MSFAFSFSHLPVHLAVQLPEPVRCSVAVPSQAQGYVITKESVQCFDLPLFVPFFEYFQIVIKKREPLNFGIPEGNTGFSSRLAATQDIPFIHQSVSML